MGDRGRTGALAVSAAEFGWGSAGKLSTILGVLSERLGALPRLACLGSDLGMPVITDVIVGSTTHPMPSSADEFARIARRHGVSAALVVLDPDLATLTEAAGCPTVYVDSLPFLWGRADPVPGCVTAYCAQRCPGQSELTETKLREVRNLHWVESIVPRPRRRDAAGAAAAVVNFGGLHSPVETNSREAYLAVALPAAIDAARAAGYTRIEIVGNVPRDRPAHLAPEVTWHGGGLPHGSFVQLLDRADVLLTSPGRTVLLEAATRSLPTVCLPPQNVSQILNAQDFGDAVTHDCVVPWPESGFDVRGVLDDLRDQGEDVALRTMYGAIHRMVSAATVAHVTAACSAAMRAAVRAHDWSGLVTRFGTDGAGQVAEHVARLLTTSTTVWDGVL